MNAEDVFRYGHCEVMRAVEGLPEGDWERPGVCGTWSAREVIAHLASYELATGDAFASVLGEGPTPTLDASLADMATFNDSQVELRRNQRAAETLAEYVAAHERASALLARIPRDLRRQPGLMAWYGAEYDLEDLITYMSYGHKREHCAQIAVARSRVMGDG